MESLVIKSEFIKGREHEGNNKIDEVVAFQTVAVLSNSAFGNCKNLKDVRFGPDITRIGNRAFVGCTSLTDVWFAITDEEKIIEIASDAFVDCPQQITFHIFASALKNKSLNDYARKHNFKVEGMI